MHDSWITLYDVSRDGIGIIPYFLAMVWIAGIIGGVIALMKGPGRLFVSLWLAFWVIAGSVGYGKNPSGTHFRTEEGFLGHRGNGRAPNTRPTVTTE